MCYREKGQFNTPLRVILPQGCHLAFLKAKSTKIVYQKRQFARNKMIWPFSGLFRMLKKIVYFKVYFGEI